MNQLATASERLPMDTVGMSTGATGAKIAPQNLAEVVKFAEVMCRADIALPKHLRGNAGACMAVALQALDWQMNPFAVAGKSYQVNGMIAYEAQLIAAVVNTRSGIKGRLRYAYQGEGNTLTCTVTGVLDGEEYSYTSPPMGAITTKNSPLWKTDPQQQLGYFSARSWARRYTPEVILGVYDREEAEQFRGPDQAKDVTPSVMQRLKANNATQQPASAAEGFNRTFAAETVSDQSDSQTGELFANKNADEDAPLASSDDASATSSLSAASEPEDDSPPSSGSTIPVDDLPKLRSFAKDLLPRAADPETSGQVMKSIEARYADDIVKLSPAGREAAKSISVSMRSILKGDVDLVSSLEFFAEMLNCTVEELGG